ncbi:P-loop containing nucleoside triphosphate hydrolase protein [Sporodiniella umbellata]|nr:P-loop containing nucleoside triphosphate hydrolase protein [Sporodiniella umbellata]
MTVTCKCGNEAIILESRAPNLNRGRWYWRCASNACRFFQWDESPYSFIQHSLDSYRQGNEISGNRFNKDTAPYVLRNSQNMDIEFVPLTRSKTRVAFTLLSDSEISIDYSANSTILPVIKNIKDIAWNDTLGKWVIPATLEAYRKAIKTLPVNTPNLQIEIDPIPQPIVQHLLTKPLRLKDLSKSKEQELQEDSFEEDDTMDIELMDRWSRFVESEVHDKLYKFQQDGVRKAIENKGRLLVANEGGIGKIPESLAIAYAYCKEWPVLVVCPSVLLHTWKEEIENFFGFDDDEVCILPDARTDIFKGVKKKTSKPKVSKKRKRASASKEYQEEEENESDSEPQRVLFYITTHEVATRRRNQIKNAKLKVAICDGAQYMKARGNTHNKAFIELLESCPRLILLSEIASHCLPVDLYTSVKAIRPDLVTTFDKFAKRYCDPKQQVIGWIYNGRSNSEELQYVLDRLVWHSPRMPVIASQIPKHICEVVVVSVKVEDSIHGHGNVYFSCFLCTLPLKKTNWELVLNVVY